MSDEHVEPWLSGRLTDVHPAVAPLLYSFQQALEDLEKWTGGLTAEQVWAKPLGLGSIGFQMRHIAGSCERLLTYAEGKQLTADQLAALKTESDQGGTREELLEQMRETFSRLEQMVRSMDTNKLFEPRVVGRKKLPTTVIGLLTHTAEHMQRHVGEAIITSKVVRASS
jgi:hypothetical protein